MTSNQTTASASSAMPQLLGVGFDKFCFGIELSAPLCIPAQPEFDAGDLPWHYTTERPRKWNGLPQPEFLCCGDLIVGVFKSRQRAYIQALGREVRLHGGPQGVYDAVEEMVQRLGSSIVGRDIHWVDLYGDVEASIKPLFEAVTDKPKRFQARYLRVSVETGDSGRSIHARSRNLKIEIYDKLAEARGKGKLDYMRDVWGRMPSWPCNSVRIEVRVSGKWTREHPGIGELFFTNPGKAFRRIVRKYIKLDGLGADLLSNCVRAIRKGFGKPKCYLKEVPRISTGDEEVVEKQLVGTCAYARKRLGVKRFSGVLQRVLSEGGGL
jgi:hypothetical protein